MKRTAKISTSGNEPVRVKINIAVECGKYELTDDEIDHAVEELVDGTMRTLSNTHYVRTALCRMKVQV